MGYFNSLILVMYRLYLIRIISYKIWMNHNFLAITSTKHYLHHNNIQGH
jgi:hypothetical protein